MDWSNKCLGSGKDGNAPSRLIIDVSSPGDVAIKDYLAAHSLEVAGDKTGSSASYLLKIVVGIVLSVGMVITLLSFFILLLSMSLLMEKNRDKLHSLLMLGYPLRKVAAPYMGIVVCASVAAWLFAVVCCVILRSSYLHSLEELGAAAGSLWMVRSGSCACTFAHDIQYNCCLEKGQGFMEIVQSEPKRKIVVENDKIML